MRNAKHNSQRTTFERPLDVSELHANRLDESRRDGTSGGRILQALGAGGWRGTRGRRVRDLRESDSPVRVRAERVDQRQELPRARQRARSDHPHAGRNTRVQDPQATHTTSYHRGPCVHHREGRSVLLSAWAQAATLPVQRGLTRGAVHSLRIAILVCAVYAPASAQNRGVYPLGMSAMNSGATPAPGLTYTNLFILYSRDESRGDDGELLATGSNSVLMDMNTFVWASSKPILGGARYAASATLPFANNSLASDVNGALSGGGGFADSYYQPVILGWDKPRVGLK